VGTIRYVGTTQFSDGVWCGVELDGAHGKNDGAVKDVQVRPECVFSCYRGATCTTPKHTRDEERGRNGWGGDGWCTGVRETESAARRQMQAE
jgi:hypothetical protein